MNAVNNAANLLFDVFLTPFELLGAAWSLIIVSGLCGVLGLLVFKQISWQGGIKGVKGRIKGNIIAIRIYQDDLAIVGKSVGGVLARNFQYLGLNFGPILPLLAPMCLVVAQFVVRYSYEPLHVYETEAQVAALLPGQGTLIEIAMKDGEEAALSGLEVRLPDGIQAISPLVRSKSEGMAAIEVVARKQVDAEIMFVVDGRAVGSKRIVAGGEAPRSFQPVRVSSFWESWLYPAESMLPDESPLAKVSMTYGARDIGLPALPAGEGGVFLGFLVASMAIGFAALKPLNVTI